MSDNFQDNIVYGQSTLAVSGDAIIVGSTDNGAKSIIFNNSGSQGHLAWQPTANETIFLPNSGGTVQLTGQVPGAVYDGANSISTGTIRFTNANGVSFSINGQTISGSVASQTNQSVGLYALGNTTQNSSTTLDARSLSFNALGVISAGFSNGSIQLSVPNATVAFSNANNVVFGSAGATTITASAFFNFSAGTTSNNLSSITFSNSNGVSFGLNGSTITGSVAAQTNQTVGIYAVSNSTQSSSGTLDARSLSFQGAGIASVGYTNGSVVISVPSGGGAGDGVNILAAGTQTANTTGTVLFSNSNGVTFGMSNNSVITASVAAGGGTLSLYATGNTTQNSSTTLDARSISFNALGAATMGYSNGSIQVSVPNGVVSFSNANGVSFGSAGATTITASVAAQSVQTQSVIQAFYDGVNSISTGTIFLSDANGVSFGINGQTITASAAGGGVALSAGANSTSTGTVVFSNSNGISFGLSNNGVITASVAAVAGSDIVFSNSNNIVFGKNVSTVTASATPLFISRWVNEPTITNVGTVIGNSLVSIFPMIIPNYISASNFRFGQSIGLATAANASTAYLDMSISGVLYTLNGSTLSSIGSGSNSYTGTWSSNATGSMSGARGLTFSCGNGSFAPGEYWLALHISTTNSATGGANTTALGNSISMMIGVSAATGALGLDPFSNATASSRGASIGLGILSTGATRATIAVSDIVQTGTRAMAAKLWLDMRNYTIW